MRFVHSKDAAISIIRRWCTLHISRVGGAVASSLDDGFGCPLDVPGTLRPRTTALTPFWRVRHSTQRRSRVRQDIDRLPAHLCADIDLPRGDEKTNSDPFFNEVLGRS